MTDYGKVYHFIGIGGIGMSAIASVMHSMGYNVQGSDSKNGAMFQQLSKKGIKLFLNHDEKNIDGVDVVVISSAVKAENIELITARKKNLIIMKRAEMLAELMREKTGIAVSGSHGKTTTTSLISYIFDVAGKNPTILSGGIMNYIGSNSKFGNGEFLIAEADESDGSFTLLPTSVAVITNLDAEHMDYYKSNAHIENSFKQFALAPSNMSVICGDDDFLYKLSLESDNRKIITYGITDRCMVRAKDVKISIDGTSFLYSKFDDDIAFFKLKILGLHNVKNALAAITVALEFGISIIDIQKALETFDGVKRRFTYVGEYNGAKIIDDYAHHPVEIAAVIDTAKRMIGDSGRVISVIQPHRYSRLNNLLNEFCEVAKKSDYTVIVPVYSAGEDNVTGISHTSLLNKVKMSGFESISEADSVYELADNLLDYVKPGDIILMLGAGTITDWARELCNYSTDSKKILSTTIQ